MLCSLLHELKGGLGFLLVWEVGNTFEILSSCSKIEKLSFMWCNFALRCFVLISLSTFSSTHYVAYSYLSACCV